MSKSIDVFGIMQCAKFLGVSRTQLKKWRETGGGPPFVPTGVKVAQGIRYVNGVYPKTGVYKWLDVQTCCESKKEEETEMPENPAADVAKLKRRRAKADKFVELIEKRMATLLTTFTQIGHLSSRYNYVYAEDQIDGIFSIIRSHVDELEMLFRAGGGKEPTAPAVRRLGDSEL